MPGHFLNYINYVDDEKIYPFSTTTVYGCRMP